MKRWIAMLLTVCMLFSLCPVGAFAESATGGTEPAQTVQTEQDTADATGATKGTAAPAEDTPKGTAAPAEGTPKENAEASNAENGNAAANNGTGNEENKENATGATNEEPKAETKTCSCKDLCDMQHPNAGCEVCANSNDVGTCCKGSVAKVDAVDPQPDAEEEELVCTTCTTKCTDAMSTIVARPARPILPSAALWKTIRPWSIPMSSMWKVSGRMPGHRALRTARP